MFLAIYLKHVKKSGKKFKILVRILVIKILKITLF
jgi:hypothetical protein